MNRHDEVFSLFAIFFLRRQKYMIILAVSKSKSFSGYLGDHRVARGRQRRTFSPIANVASCIVQCYLTHARTRLHEPQAIAMRGPTPLD